MPVLPAADSPVSDPEGNLVPNLQRRFSLQPVGLRLPTLNLTANIETLTASLAKIEKAYLRRKCIL
jgi:hypothetical protein